MLLLLAFLFSTPESFLEVGSLRDLLAENHVAPLLIAALIAASILNLLFGTKLADAAAWIAVRAGEKIATLLSKQFAER